MRAPGQSAKLAHQLIMSINAQELARELGVNLPVGTQASLIADAGVATGHDNPLL